MKTYKPDFSIDFKKKKVEIWYDIQGHNLPEQWGELKEGIISRLKAHLKATKECSCYSDVCNMLEPQIYLLSIRYYEQIQKSFIKDDVKKYYTPSLLLGEILKKVFPIKYLFLYQWQIKLQILLGIIILFVSLFYFFQNQSLTMFSFWGSILSLYGGLSITISSNLSDKQILQEFIRPPYCESIYLFKNLTENQLKNFFGIIFMLLGFLIQIVSNYFFQIYRSIDHFIAFGS